MNSLAIWYAGSEEKKASLEVHFNYWKLPSRNGTFSRFLDVGLNLRDASKIDDLFLFLPFAVDTQQLDDLGQVIVGGAEILTAIFNEDYKITSAQSSDYHEVRDADGNEVFHIYEMSKDSFSVESRYDGTVISIPLPEKNIRKDKTYLRFRISGNSLIDFSSIETNVSSMFGSAFSKTEIFDFRINSTRHLPNKLLEEIIQAHMFCIPKIHFFYICSYRENYVLSHTPFSGARKLEEDLWQRYMTVPTVQLNDIRPETLIAYHWKEKAEAGKSIDQFNVLMKTNFRHNDWTTIAKYLAFLIVFTLSTGVCANYLFSKIATSGKKEDTTAQVSKEDKSDENPYDIRAESENEQEPGAKEPDEEKE